MEIRYYLTPTGNNPVLKYIESLPMDEMVDGYTVIQHMEHDEFDQIYSKQWSHKIYEVYFYRSNRIFFAYNDGNQIYLLHACKKQKGKTLSKDVKVVKNRAKTLGKTLGKKLV